MLLRNIISGLEVTDYTAVPPQVTVPPGSRQINLRDLAMINVGPTLDNDGDISTFR